MTVIANYLYDATNLYARAVHSMLNNGDNINDAALVVKYLKNTTFNGINIF